MIFLQLNVRGGVSLHIGALVSDIVIIRGVANRPAPNPVRSEDPTIRSAPGDGAPARSHANVHGQLSLPPCFVLKGLGEKALKVPSMVLPDFLVRAFALRRALDRLSSTND